MDNLFAEYEKKHQRKKLYYFLMICFTVLLGAYFVTIGLAKTTINDVFSAIIAFFNGTINTSENSSSYKIILLMRLPRVVMAMFAGIGLSVSGVAMQGITRNPLVSPFTIGISSAAAFGASMFIVFGSTYFPAGFNEIGTVSAAFISSIICAVLVYKISAKVGMTPHTIVLAGIALNYFFSAMTSAIEFFAEENRLAAVVHWSFGSLNAVTWAQTVVVVAFVSFGVFLINKYALILNVMCGGEEDLVVSLGIKTEKVRSILGSLSVIMTAAIISFTGVIGFVGLVAPHISRLVVGNDHRYLIPFSALVGALLLMISDVIGRTILEPVSIPVGIVVSFLGVPLFINLILAKPK